MDHPAPVELAEIPLLSTLPQPYLESLAAQFEVEEFGAEHVIVREGDAGYAFYIIKDGTAVVTQEGREIRQLGPGDFFGEISIVEGGRRTATVTSSTPMVVWTLFGTEFRVLETADPEVAAALQGVIAVRLASDSVT
jgi:CRP/FNR family transcriptional regulator, cyclic AMP receptor protein